MPAKAARLKALEICGFRSFGAEPQTLTFSGDLAIIWGANSQGKSSLAEALEFLLTGCLVRKALVASAQDEFAEALRNVHLPESVAVYVQAEVECPDGSPRTVRRTLTADHGKKRDCSTALTIDGAPAKEKDLAALGIVLSQAPLSAPILAQHTLSYLFSAKPQERALYFKNLLDVTDLDEFRDEVQRVQDSFSAASVPLLEKVTDARNIRNLGPHLVFPDNPVPPLEGVTAELKETAGALLTAEGETPPDALEHRLESIRTLLETKRAAAFPAHGLSARAAPTWTPPDATTWKPFKDFLTQKRKVEEETRRLSDLFTALLEIPSVKTAETALDCPICETPAGLTPERITAIQRSLRETAEYQAARASTSAVLRKLEASLSSLGHASDASLPPCLKWPPAERRRLGFRSSRFSELLPLEHHALATSWFAKARQLARSRRSLQRASKEASAALQPLIADPDHLDDLGPLQGVFEAVGAAHRAYLTAHANYRAAEDDLSPPLQAVVDAASKTDGWQAFLDLGENPAALRETLLDGAARAKIAKELSRALKDIDGAKSSVLQDKFTALSKDVQTWWDILRPDEPTFFSALGPRPKTTRTIDFKAGLSPHEDRSTPQIRDVIAVFSQSQLHCLGLALFLARALRERTGFIVLDDPVLASDEEHRAHFNHAGVDKLLRDGCQTIVLTQDRTTLKELQNRYGHLHVDTFEMVLDDPRKGTELRATSDDLAAMLTQARPFVRSNEPELRKRAGERLRDAAERFCKELLIKERRATGEAAAALGDYDARTLNWLITEVEPYLRDAGHPGRLHAIRDLLNPANHDGGIPDKGTLRVAHGDLKYFRKEYLR